MHESSANVIKMLNPGDKEFWTWSKSFSGCQTSAARSQPSLINCWGPQDLEHVDSISPADSTLLHSSRLPLEPASVYLRLI